MNEPATTLSLAAVLAEPARRVPDAVAVVQGEHRMTYAEVWERARSTAAALRDRGIGPDDRVALLAPNVVEFVTGYYGILAAGGVVVPVPTLLQAQEAAHLVSHSGATLLLHHEAFGEIAAEVSADTGVAAVSLHGLGDDVEPVSTYATRRPEDPAVVFYTSGTTGRPKGAVLTHLNLVMNCTVGAFDGNPLERGEIVMGCLPLFHTYGQSSGMNTCFRLGSTLVLQPRFDAAEAIAIMVHERATRFLGVPTMYVALLEAAASATELPRLRSCASGGASLPVVVLERFEEAFDTVVHEGYGLSETSPTASVNQQTFGTRPGSIGHAVWGVDVEIAAESPQDEILLLPAGERGEIVVRGHNVFAGYLDDDAATEAVVVDGWFRTGDVGVKDDDGFVRVVDRLKDLVIRAGFNVYPREVEEVLARHDGVAQVAVIGLPDDVVGEEVCAVVVPIGAGAVAPADLVAWSRERLGHHKYPRLVEIVDQLPLGPTHKVLKRELRARFTPTDPAREDRAWT